MCKSNDACCMPRAEMAGILGALEMRNKEDFQDKRLPKLP